jgi:hypothetical protein
VSRRADVAAGLVVALTTLLTAEAAVRRSYDRAVQAIAAESLERATADPHAAAQWAVEARNLAKRDARRWDLEAVRLREEDRNQLRYGDPLGPSYAQLREKLDDVAILASAARTNPERDRGAVLTAAIAPGIALAAGLWRGFTGTARDTLRAWLCGPLAWLAARALGALGVWVTSPLGRDAQHTTAFIAMFIAVGLGVLAARRLVPEDAPANATTAHL